MGKKLKESIGTQIQELRKALNMSQVELSKKTKIAQGDLSRIEAGKGNISLATLERIANVLKCVVTLKRE